MMAPARPEAAAADRPQPRSGMSPRFQARLKPEHTKRYPELKAWLWYDVEPLWPGLRTRMVNLEGERISRLRLDEGMHALVRAAHLEFRPGQEEEATPA
jgi:hypothetical protein